MKTLLLVALLFSETVAQCDLQTDDKCPLADAGVADTDALGLLQTHLQLRDHPDELYDSIPGTNSLNHLQDTLTPMKDALAHIKKVDTFHSQSQGIQPSQEGHIQHSQKGMLQEDMSHIKNAKKDEGVVIMNGDQKIEKEKALVSSLLEEGISEKEALEEVESRSVSFDKAIAKKQELDPPPKMEDEK